MPSSKITDEETFWSRITEWPDEKRVTWACGVLGRVLAQGEAKMMTEGRKALNTAVARLDQEE